MSLKIYNDIVQGSDEWFELRRGILTASEMKLIVTPTLKTASNEKERAHLYELLSQRITGYVEPSYISDDMLRGHEEEVEAKIAYAKNYAPVEEVGFMTNDKWGFPIGYSPDGLVGDDGAIEAKSRKQKLQLETILSKEVPAEHMIQLQTGLLVSERKWIDYISYCGGMPMFTLKVYPDEKVQAAILEAAALFYGRMDMKLKEYNDILSSGVYRLIPTERKEEEEIEVI